MRIKIVDVIEQYGRLSNAAKWIECFGAAAKVCELDSMDLAAIMPVLVKGAVHDVNSQLSDATKKDYKLRTDEGVLLSAKEIQ